MGVFAIFVLLTISIVVSSIKVVELLKLSQNILKQYFCVTLSVAVLDRKRRLLTGDILPLVRHSIGCLP